MTQRAAYSPFVGVGDDWADNERYIADCQNRGGVPQLDEDGIYMGCSGGAIDPAAQCANEGGTWCPAGFCAPPGEECPMNLPGIGELTPSQFLALPPVANAFNLYNQGIPVEEVGSYMSRSDIIYWVGTICPIAGVVVAVLDKLAGFSGSMGWLLQAMCSQFTAMGAAGDRPNCPEGSTPLFDADANFVGCQSNMMGADCTTDQGLPGTLNANDQCIFNAARIQSESQGQSYCDQTFGGGAPHFNEDANGYRYLAGCCPPGAVADMEFGGCKCPDGTAWDEASQSCLIAEGPPPAVQPKVPSKGLVPPGGGTDVPPTLPKTDEKKDAGTPWWVWVVGAVGVIGLGGAIWYASSKTEGEEGESPALPPATL